MAKDGTNRGGARPGAGRKPKSKTDKILEGKEVKDNIISEIIPKSKQLEGVDMPSVKDYLKAHQKNGKPLRAEDVYNEIYQWLKARGCEKLVSVQLIEQYSMSVSRWIQCEECISEYGFLAKHPTTGAPIASPYVSMSQGYLKQSQQAWYQIQQIVRDNFAGGFSDSLQDNKMEQLLNSRKS